jgi:hypothetical protein
MGNTYGGRRQEERMGELRLMPWKPAKTKAVGAKLESNWGGIAIYELVGVEQGELVAVKYRYEFGDSMSRMRSAKIRWAIPRRRAEDGDKPVDPIPYFNTSHSGRVYLDQAEMCYPGWGPMWGAEYVRARAGN